MWPLMSLSKSVVGDHDNYSKGYTAENGGFHSDITSSYILFIFILKNHPQGLERSFLVGRTGVQVCSLGTCVIQYCSFIQWIWLTLIVVRIIIFKIKEYNLFQKQFRLITNGTTAITFVSWFPGSHNHTWFLRI